MFFILISGKAGSGKDTAGYILRRILQERYGVQSNIAHFGDLVKMIAEKYFGWNGEKDEEGRSLLQFIGNDRVRKIDPDFWARFLSDSIRFFSDQWDCTIVPDTRYPNEIEYLQNNYPTYTIRVSTDTQRIPMTETQKENLSEISLDDYTFQYEVQNNEGLDAFSDALQTIAQDIYRKEYII